jgi:non-ribosomal peptide synthetase component F
VLFNWQKPPRQAKGDGAAAVELFDVPGREGQFDLSLEIGEGPDKLWCTFRYNTDLFDTGTTEQMASWFQELLRQVASAPDKRISMLRLMPLAEERKIVVTWNDTDAAYPVDLCLHHLIEAQADRTPNVPALRSEEVELSYGELNRNANLLARRCLCQAGRIGP